MKAAVSFLAIAALTFLANMSTASVPAPGVTGNFSWDGARTPGGATTNGYIWLKQCQAAGRCPED